MCARVFCVYDRVRASVFCICSHVFSCARACSCLRRIMTRDWQRRYRNGFKCKFERDIMYARNTTKMHNAQCFFGAPQQNARSRAAFLEPRLPALHACLHFALACKSVTLCTCTFGSSSRSQVHDVTCHVRGELLSAGYRHPPLAPTPPPNASAAAGRAIARLYVCARALACVCVCVCLGVGVGMRGRALVCDK